MTVAKMQLVIITGMSGAGRRTAAHTLEDLGWYVVDNLPAAMLPELVTFLASKNTSQLVVVLDVRTRGDLQVLPQLFDQIAPITGRPQIVFIEASDLMIVRRQESVRRPVPLQGDGPLLDGIAAERAMISSLRAAADLVIDTTELSKHHLEQRMVTAFGGGQSELMITVMSFGFKNGVPLDADQVYDVRFLPNPHWVSSLRAHTGLSPAVARYVMDSPLAKQFVEQLDAIFATIVAGYRVEGKRMVEVAIGCTGGKHRSVAIAETMAERWRGPGRQLAVIHRDLGRE
jgi:UPF0042 nucleotide-binding protein